MSNSTSTTTSRTAADLFHPVEHAILARWLGTEPPEAAKSPEVAALLSEKNDHYVTLESVKGTDEDSAYANAVARILLEEIQETLPQWGRVSSAQGVELSREHYECACSRILPVPELVCTINWANSGPGFSWPESYHVTRLPYYDRFVVTLSVDCEEVYSYTDLALGHFSEDTPIFEGVKEVVIAHWTKQRSDTQERWVELFDTGLVSGDEAEEWAEEVWL